MTTPSFGSYSHVAAQAQALQFDGTLAGLLTIFRAVAPNPAGVQVIVNFDGTGHVGNAVIGGPTPVSINPTDWVVIPSDGSPLAVLHDGEFQGVWQ